MYICINSVLKLKIKELFHLSLLPPTFVGGSCYHWCPGQPSPGSPALALRRSPPGSCTCRQAGWQGEHWHGGPGGIFLSHSLSRLCFSSSPSHSLLNPGSLLSSGFASLSTCTLLHNTCHCLGSTKAPVGQPRVWRLVVFYFCKINHDFSGNPSDLSQNPRVPQNPGLETLL